MRITNHNIKYVMHEYSILEVSHTESTFWFRSVVHEATDHAGNPRTHSGWERLPEDVARHEISTQESESNLIFDSEEEALSDDIVMRRSKDIYGEAHELITAFQGWLVNQKRGNATDPHHKPANSPVDAKRDILRKAVALQHDLHDIEVQAD